MSPVAPPLPRVIDGLEFFVAYETEHGLRLVVGVGSVVPALRLAHLTTETSNSCDQRLPSRG